MDRSVQWFQIQEIDTSWALPLGDLFQAENIPDDPETYLDQRYLDYLAQNSEDLHRIHWRNFERLTTEFFSRKGFEVELGPGGDDRTSVERYSTTCSAIALWQFVSRFHRLVSSLIEQPQGPRCEFLARLLPASHPLLMFQMRQLFRHRNINELI